VKGLLFALRLAVAVAREGVSFERRGLRAVKLSRLPRAVRNSGEEVSNDSKYAASAARVLSS
jgi:hypothetical protein